jgi:hypothetical protein
VDDQPIRTIDIANCLVKAEESKRILTVMLLEEDQVEIFECDDVNELQSWFKVISHVSYRWGLVQKTEMEHEIASMRKQLGQLWDLCVDGIVPTKVQKVKKVNEANQGFND